MALNFYPSFENNILLGKFGDMTAATLMCAAVSGSYIYSSSHTSLSDITDYVLGAVALTGASVASGQLSTDDFTFSGISSGTVTSLIYYLDSGTASTSFLILYDSSATNLPYTFTGTDVLVTAPAYLVKLTAV
jgi:hypothetical protein